MDDARALERDPAGPDRLAEDALAATSARAASPSTPSRPGRIDTDRLKEVYPDGPSEADLAVIPLRRLGRPRELGDVVSFLASDRPPTSPERRSPSTAASRADSSSGETALLSRTSRRRRARAPRGLRVHPLDRPSDSYLLLPDEAKPLESRVTVEGEKPDTAGGIYFVDVIVRKASRLEKLLPFAPPRRRRPRPRGGARAAGHEHPGPAPAEPAPDGPLAGGGGRGRAARSSATTSRREPRGALVAAVASDAPAAGKLEPTRRDRRRRRQARQHARRPAPPHLDAEAGRDGRAAGPRGRRHEKGPRRHVESPSEPGRAIVGIQVEQSADIDLPIDVYDRSRRSRRPLRGARVRARHRRGAARERRPAGSRSRRPASSSSTAESSRSAA